MKTYWGSGYIVPSILNLSIKKKFKLIRQYGWEFSEGQTFHSLGSLPTLSTVPPTYVKPHIISDKNDNCNYKDILENSGFDDCETMIFKNLCTSVNQRAGL